MLNPFPILLSFGILAPLLLRVTIGIIFIYISYFVIYKNRNDFFSYYKKNKYPAPGVVTWFIGILNALAGLFFIVGFLTQIVAIVSIYLLSSLYLSDKDIGKFKFSGAFYVLMGVVCLSMILLGAGAFAVDLPL